MPRFPLRNIPQRMKFPVVGDVMKSGHLKFVYEVNFNFDFIRVKRRWPKLLHSAKIP